MAAWLQRRREDARAGHSRPRTGTGLPCFRAGRLPPPRTEADEGRWQDRLEALVACRDAGNDWPRHKVTVAGLEHDLGVWLHSQRAKLHRGELEGAKEQALDEALPGWRDGRQRGRKPRENGAAASISLGKA
ncbi:helicase associated domain-containing protein [Arthrobacter globiformis]|uniref:helicase associated domain-containing protein n=1 Tax=Arthrobacter globiformis TaxID=1665 RepID=UPI00278E98CB|nr:helicase associated domain-containing protein [Arthrobacter globiformis]MDQ0619209.1 hypothetical protein [Arthrobacter globiformis]